jgi:hypothetical protein
MSAAVAAAELWAHASCAQARFDFDSERYATGKRAVLRKSPEALFARILLGVPHRNHWTEP